MTSGPVSDSVLSETRTQARARLTERWAERNYLRQTRWATKRPFDELPPDVRADWLTAASADLDALLAPELRQSLLTLLGETETRDLREMFDYDTRKINELTTAVRRLTTFFRMVDSGGPDGTELDTLVYDEARAAADVVDPPTEGEW